MMNSVRMKLLAAATVLFWLPLIAIVTFVGPDTRRAIIAETGIITAGVLVFAIAGSVWASGRFARPIKEAAAALRRLGQDDGDLTTRVRVETNDEIGELADNFNGFMDKLEQIVVRVQAIAASVTEAAGDLSQATADIASGARGQASSLQRTAGSLQEMTATVKQNAENAVHASEVADGARDIAEHGGRVVGDAVGAMVEIDGSSNRIADIITTIDEIAFQTNLLALNAAVEAARAGDQGRGFAVVANEVRNLAGRSATAAKEIKLLIQDSVRKVKDGTELVGKSGHSLEEIVSAVQKVTGIVGEIAAASREQSAGIEDVNRAVTSMDDTTRTNVSRTEQLRATSGRLGEEAIKLLALVGQFRVGPANRHSAPTTGTEPVSESRFRSGEGTEPTSEAGVGAGGSPFDGFEEF